MKYLVVYHFKKVDVIKNHYYKDKEEMEEALKKVDRRYVSVLHKFKIEELVN